MSALETFLFLLRLTTFEIIPKEKLKNNNSKTKTQTKTLTVVRAARSYPVLREHNI